MNHIKQLDRSPGFVRLQVADQMPARSFPTNQGNLCFRFLDAVLAEVGRSGRYGWSNRFGRMGLAYGHQPNFFRPAIGPRSGRRDTLVHVIKTLTKVFLALQL